MKRELLIEYGNALNELLKSAKLVSYFLANIRSDDEIKSMLKFIKDKPSANETDLDEHLIFLRS